MKVTKVEITKNSYSTTFVIPKGTPVVEASNLPYEDFYWAEPWEGMSEDAECELRNYGFLVHLKDTEES